MNPHQELLSQAVTYLAGSLGHDLNNYLTLILGNCDMVKMESPDSESSVVSIERAARKIEGAITGLTAIAAKQSQSRKRENFGDLWNSTIAKVRKNLTADESLVGSDPIDDASIVHLDTAVFPIAIYFATKTLFGDGTKKAVLEVDTTSSTEIQITLRGGAGFITKEICESASSTSDEIILGTDEMALGLSMVKAYSVRSRGRFRVALESDNEASITLVLPKVQTIKSFRKD